MVELNCETDFVARNDEFKQLAKDLALHIMAANPLYVRREDVPEDVVAEQKRIFMTPGGRQARRTSRRRSPRASSTPGSARASCSTRSSSRTTTKTVRDVILAVNSRTGENISVARFARFVVGEAR